MHLSKENNNIDDSDEFLNKLQKLNKDELITFIHNYYIDMRKHAISDINNKTDYMVEEFGRVRLTQLNMLRNILYYKNYQKEYESYMKKVTDAFIDMQSDKINGTIGHDKDSVFYEVIWNGGLDYKFDLNCSRYIKGITFEEMKKNNADVAKRYLLENKLSYNEWFEKFIKNKK